MLFLVAYDVTEPKRMRRLASCCELYGGRVEKSLFEIDLPEHVFERFWSEACAIVNQAQDALVAYRICAACEAEIKTIGVAVRPQKQLCLFI